MTHEGDGFDLDRDAIAEVPGEVVAQPEPLEVPVVDVTTQKLKAAAEWKEKGNKLYASKDFLGALEMYDAALEGTAVKNSEQKPALCRIALPQTPPF